MGQNIQTLGDREDTRGGTEKRGTEAKPEDEIDGRELRLRNKDFSVDCDQGGSFFLMLTNMFPFFSNTHQPISKSDPHFSVFFLARKNLHVPVHLAFLPDFTRGLALGWPARGQTPSGLARGIPSRE
jgi:hypothetical protein